ncbi:MAG: tyrosine--tRNA ligase [Firmicutes bacterium]|nr:tyrosine--tRNA ligase [Bacillota bacterium]
MKKQGKTNAFDVLRERGFVHSTSHEKEIREALGSGPVTFYLGIDPTADNLHIGHFFALRAFRIMQDHGHKGIILIGNATAVIGDPSFKNDMRKMLSQEAVDKNARDISNILTKFLDVKNTTIVYNADWFKNINYVSALLDIGAHFNIAEMLSKDIYKNRLGNGLTFMEMGYMLMQGYDFVHLNEKYGCTLQIGGSDQWSNILSGVELGRKKQKPLMMAFCTPLLTNHEGQKMGKTEKGALWVSGGSVTAYDFYQYFVNAHDNDVERLLLFFSDLPVPEIKTLCTKDIVLAKRTMALAVTELIHGKDGAEKAKEMSAKLFSGDTGGADAPTVSVVCPSRSVVDVLVAANLAKSKREAREFITGGAITIDNDKITDVEHVVNKNECLVKKGKKTFLRIQIK